MYIAPDSDIKILHNVPLDNTYEHTIYFANATAQYTYFNGLSKYSFTDQSYARVQRGFLKLQRKAEDLYDCNYLMFRNTAFGTKWFYAFIKSVEYVNNVTSMIEFEIDVIQTWFFDFSFQKCFVEREHTVTDVIGEHIEPEPVECGEYVYNYYGSVDDTWAELCVIVGVVSSGESASSGSIYDGVYCGSQLKAFNKTDRLGLNAELGQYLQAPDSVVNLYMVPRRAVSANSIPDGGMAIPTGQSGYNITYTLGSVTNSTKLDGYTPRNKKLLTYPYTFENVTNASGSSLTIRYEFSRGGTAKIRIYSSLLPPVGLVCYPWTYKVQDSENTTTFVNESISVNNFPLCSWNFDAYQAWQAQNSVPLGLNVASSIASSVASGAGMVAMNPANSPMAAATVVGSAISAVTNVLSQNYTASIAADISKGSASNGCLNACNGLNQFYHGRMSCTAQYARVIDEFFDKFGYKVARVKTPNRNSRPVWNYVKTISATIEGSIPADDMKKICMIHDNGITYWKNGSQVGHYELSNSPT